MEEIDKFSVVIPASGIGKRMQSAIAKQYLTIGSKTVLEHTLACFLDLPTVEYVVVVIAPHDDYFHTLSLATHPKIMTVIGGKERANSVFNGIDYLKSKDVKWVMVHDAARPCVTKQDIMLLLNQCLDTQQAGILAVPVRDTMKRARGKTNLISKTEDRTNLWHALTPQCILVNQLHTALSQQTSADGAINPEVTDEASALELAGFPVSLVSGNAKNIKITQPEDLELAEYYLKSIN